MGDVGARDGDLAETPRSGLSPKMVQINNFSGHGVDESVDRLRKKLATEEMPFGGNFLGGGAWSPGQVASTTLRFLGIPNRRVILTLIPSFIGSDGGEGLLRCPDLVMTLSCWPAARSRRASSGSPRCFARGGRDSRLTNRPARRARLNRGRNLSSCRPVSPTDTAWSFFLGRLVSRLSFLICSS